MNITLNSFKNQIKILDQQLELLELQSKNNNSQNIGFELYNLSCGTLNLAQQMLEAGNQYPLVMGDNRILLSSKIQNYGMQILNLASQLNNNYNLNNMFNTMNNMGMQINNNMNFPYMLNNANFNINNNQNSESVLQKEFKSCCEDSYLIHAGTKFELENNDINKWNFTMQGPLGTPYEDGFFKFIIQFPKEYPHKGAEIKFITKIYHPNANIKGDLYGNICYPILNEWKLTGKARGKGPYTIKEAIYDLFAFFYKPHDCPDNEEASNDYFHNKEKFKEEARKWTKEYASNAPDNFIKRKTYPY